MLHLEGILKSLPEHHNPRGGFRNIWPDSQERPSPRDRRRWLWQRFRNPPAHLPGPDDFPRAQAQLADGANASSEQRLTWIGQSTYLIQSAGLNLLTDPVFSQRASPLRWLGPARFSAPGLALNALPPLHAILLSHDHYDHLDAASVRALARRHRDVLWLAPLGHAALLRRLGARRIVELDWWQPHTLAADSAGITFTALPAQHWTRRLGSPANARLWCSWGITSGNSRIYFAGDSGYGPVFREVGERAGPFQAALLPIGAYEPRWIMKRAHMNPEEAVQACIDLRAQHFLAMHWGTFWLTDEDPLEPPQRVRAAWNAAGLPPELLHIPALGETRRLPALAGRSCGT